MKNRYLSIENVIFSTQKKQCLGRIRCVWNFFEPEGVGGPAIVLPEEVTDTQLACNKVTHNQLHPLWRNVSVGRRGSNYKRTVMQGR